MNVTPILRQDPYKKQIDSTFLENNGQKHDMFELYFKKLSSIFK